MIVHIVPIWNPSKVHPKRSVGFLQKNREVIFLVFIGGITYAEIEGIRFMNQINKDFKFIIITTSIVNPKKIFDSLEPEIPTSIKMKEVYEMHIAMKKKKK